MERLWSPWRMEYIEANKDAPDDDRGCVFCALLAGELTDQPAPLRVEDLAFVSLAKYPYNPGHLVVLPTRHTGELEDLTADELSAIDGLLQRSVRVLREASDPHGFNVGLNLGKSAGGSLAEHLHMHVVPRWSGDANFITIIGGSKVVPQLLRETRELLAAEWGNQP
jgi:ATP adenylyltransferase